MAVTTHSLGIVRSGEREPTPWKNGQGATREIARRLLGVRGPHFVWRLSVSDIDKDADFGTFPGVQRSATLIHGDGMALDVAEMPVRRLVARHQQVHGPPDAAQTLRSPIERLTVVVVGHRQGVVPEVLAKPIEPFGGLFPRRGVKSRIVPGDLEAIGAETPHVV